MSTQEVYVVLTYKAMVPDDTDLDDLQTEVKEHVQMAFDSFSTSDDYEFSHDLTKVGTSFKIEILK
jgi:hypothetical protein